MYAFRRDVAGHEAHREWLLRTVRSRSAYGLSDLVLSGFVRIVTNAKAFANPSTTERALGFASILRERPNCVLVSPGVRHWSIFAALCRAVNAKGNLVPDAYLAAMAIESGSEFVTTDRDYARFPGLRWRHPFDER